MKMQQTAQNSTNVPGSGVDLVELLQKFQFFLQRDLGGADRLAQKYFLQNISG